MNKKIVFLFICIITLILGGLYMYNKNTEKHYIDTVLTPLNGNLIKTLCSRLLILCILQEISSLVFVEFDYYYSF